MEKYKELIDFAERIKAKGVPEQQYIADGIFGLCADLMTAQAERDTEREADNPSVISDDTSLYTREASKDGAVVPLFPKGDFPEKGYIVEDKGGIRWEVAEVSYVCERVTPEEESAFRIPGIRMNFSASEIGTEVRVIGK